MNITLQNNASEKNALTKLITDIASLTGDLRTLNCSITDPVITFEVDTSIISNSSKINYFTIPDFGRSYFVTAINFVGVNLWEISGHVDVLSSFKSEILANKGIIRRNEEKFNLYIDDGDFRIYQKPIIKTASFSNGFTPNSSSFVLAVAGAN